MNLSAWTIVVVSGGLLCVALAFITLNRYIRYKERVALAQLGLSLDDLARQEGSRRHGNKGVLWGGVITAMSGLALYLGLATLGTGVWLIGGLLPLFVGAGMIAIYFLTLGASSRSDVSEAESEKLASQGMSDASPEAPEDDGLFALDQILSQPRPEPEEPQAET